MKTRIEKIAEEIEIPVECAEKMVLREHELAHIIPVEDLATVQVEMDEKMQEYLNKVTIALKVSADAVLFAAVMDQIDKAESDRVIT